MLKASSSSFDLPMIFFSSSTTTEKQRKKLTETDIYFVIRMLLLFFFKQQKKTSKFKIEKCSFNHIQRDREAKNKKDSKNQRTICVCVREMLLEKNLQQKKKKSASISNFSFSSICVCVCRDRMFKFCKVVVFFSLIEILIFQFNQYCKQDKIQFLVVFPLFRQQQQHPSNFSFKQKNL